MGGCCSTKNTNGEISEEYSMVTQSIINTNILAFNNSQLEKVLLMNQDKHRETLNKILKENINKLIENNPSFKIFSIYLEQIWNITKFFQVNYTNSDFILFDLRDRKLKNENVLKSFKCISYTIGEISKLSKDKMLLFKRFLYGKTLILIPSSENVNDICELIKLFTDSNINQCKIYILADILNDEYIQTPYTFLLHQKMEDRNYFVYPDILFPLKCVSYIESENFLFIKKVNKKEEIMNEQGDIFKFLFEFKVKIILDIGGSNNSTINSSSLNDILYIQINRCPIEDNERKTQLRNIIKIYILEKNSILIMYNDDALHSKYLIKWISFIFNNFLFNESNLKLNSFLIKNLDKMFILNQSFFDELSVQLQEDYDNLQKKKFTNLSNQLKNNIAQEISSLYNDINHRKKFLQNIKIIEKIILNILMHPKNVKYYHIKKESNTFKSKIGLNKHSLEIIKIFGFKEKIKEYLMSIEVDLKIIQEVYDFFGCIIRNIIE